jgi:flagellar biosynthetic protein FlhB
MAENNEDRNLEDLSEQASPYRLEEYRKKGQVAQSREVVALAVAVACGMVLFSTAPGMAKEIIDFMKETFSQDLSMKPGEQLQEVAGKRLLQMIRIIASIGLPVTIVGFLLGIGGHLGQIGFLFTSEPLMPDFEKINPLKGLTRLFSMRNLIESARVIIKGLILCFVAYSILKTAIEKSPRLTLQNPAAMFTVLGETGKLL